MKPLVQTGRALSLVLLVGAAGCNGFDLRFTLDDGGTAPFDAGAEPDAAAPKGAADAMVDPPVDAGASVDAAPPDAAPTPEASTDASPDAADLDHDAEPLAGDADPTATDAGGPDA